MRSDSGFLGERFGLSFVGNDSGFRGERFGLSCDSGDRGERFGLSWGAIWAFVRFGLRGKRFGLSWGRMRAFVGKDSGFRDSGFRGERFEEIGGQGRHAGWGWPGSGLGTFNQTQASRSIKHLFSLKPRSKRSFDNIRFDESNPGCEPILRLQNLPKLARKLQKLAGRGITTDRKRTFAENVEKHQKPYSIFA